MKIKHMINLHKGLSFPFILLLMVLYGNFTISPCIYLALHGGYGILWLFKDSIYPDKQWEEEIPIVSGILGFFVICLYWVAPFILISNYIETPILIITLAIVINIFGVFFHYGSDAQKYYTLKYKKGLITEGFFARCRNPNYLGEILTYASFAMLAQHWLPFLILGGFIVGLFIPNMLKKDQSLARYPEFEEYKNNSGLLFPKLGKIKSNLKQKSSVS